MGNIKDSHIQPEFLFFCFNAQFDIHATPIIYTGQNPISDAPDIFE
jgi:hypothetical protein